MQQEILFIKYLYFFGNTDIKLIIVFKYLTGRGMKS